MHFVLLFLLLFITSASASVRISEFLTENDGLVRDQDGDTPDWIELQNTGASAVNLSGWFLTDDATNLTKWAFPAVSINPAGYLLVFASGKNRTNAASELHTNFQLDNNGEYLALVQPDGLTIAHAFAPYPPQHANISFGSAPQVIHTPLLGSGASAKVFVPTDNALANTWTNAAFNDTAWSPGATGIGFDTSPTGAVVLRLDFNRRGADQPSTTLPGWNAFLINSNGGTVIQTAPSIRTYGSITVTLSNSTAVGYDDRLRSLPTNTATFTDSLLLRDFVFARNQTDNGGLDLTLDGLLPNQLYAITIWSFDSSSPGSRVSDWYANGVLVRENYIFGGQNAPTSNDQYRFTFQISSDGIGRIVISGRRDSASLNGTTPDFGVFLNALQITQLGYQSLIATDVASSMQNQNASAYIRIPFSVSDTSAIQQLKLRMKYDDGFAAFLNGRLIASANAPAPLAWNSAATAAHLPAQAIVFEDFLSDSPGLLMPGNNLLAIQGLNVSAADTDFLILPELEGMATLEFADQYYAIPTPRADNAAGFSGVVADTKFSVDRGFYDAPFTVTLSTATAGAQIWYTLNGSKPSPTNGFLYSSPLAITNTAFVRAAAYKSGFIPSDVDTHSYIFLDSVLRQPNTLPGYPTVWQASYPADYAMDSNIVNHPVYGATIKNDLRSIPTLSIVSDHNGLWNSTTGIYPNPTSAGPAWEREASLELISGAGETEFATRCGIELHGNASRDNVRTPKHSLRLTFKHEYGPTKLRHDWFGGGINVHDGIVLRSCGFVDGWAGRYADNSLYTSTETGETFRGLRYRPENTCYLRDVWVKDSFRDMGWAASRSAFVHLYINGLYWGLYEPSERVNASYFSLLQGGQEGAWDVVVGEDNNGPPILVDGSLTDWQNVLNLVNAGITTEAAYQSVAELVDLDNLIDYMIVHIVAESEDWPRHNWYVAHRRATNGVPGTKFVCSVWDQELTLDRLVRRNRIDVGTTGGEVYGPARVYAQLRAWPEFRRQFGDRVQKHLFNGGALTPSNSVARLLAPAAIIHDALVGESARWGDARKDPVPPTSPPQIGTGKTFTRDEWWQPEIDKLATNFFQTVTAVNIARFRAGNLFPTLNAPQFSQFGGAVPSSFALTISHANPAGTIFFTTDGSDPRAYGNGQIAGSAQAYSEPITFNRPTLVRARVVNGSTWSALVEATFYPPQDFSRLALTEIMYNPPAIGATNGDNFEFVELKNTGTNILDLSGLVFSGLNFTFPYGTVLLTGQFCVLVRNPDAFTAKYPAIGFQGVFLGGLNNGGETLRLATPDGATVFSVTYADDGAWPLAADSYGYSIVPRHGGLTQAPDNGADWRASALLGGSPGADDPEPTVPPIFINEVLSASVPPDVDKIELFNPNIFGVNIGGWFLTDTKENPRKFRIPNETIIPARGYLAFDESQFNATPGTNSSFALSSTGEEIYLFSADTDGNLTGFTHGFIFGAADPEVSFGRYVNSAGEEQFPAQFARTFADTNSGPRIGPVIINEVHYHPAVGADEFVELLNVTPDAVSIAGWRLDGLAFPIPEASIGPFGYVVLSPIDPAAFRLAYAVPDEVPVLGPYAGALQDSGERLKLQHPGAPDTNGIVPYITVDEVRYNDRAPWPPSPDGSGSSLARRSPPAYADDPINWMSAVPTPGRANLSDGDGDGLPDDWEALYGITDSDADADVDGVNNLQEYRAGTNPNDPASFLQINQIAISGSTVVLEIAALANHTYTLLYKQRLDASPWSKLRSIPVAPTNRTIQISDSPAPAQTRFYRLITPAAP